MKSYLYKHCVPFQDTDMAGVVHFTRILSYVELAEHAFLKKLNVDVISAEGGFPKVHVECNYSAPLRFGDVIEVHLVLNKCSQKSLHWEFKILSNALICANGKFVTAHINRCGEAEIIPKKLKDKWL